MNLLTAFIFAILSFTNLDRSFYLGVDLGADSDRPAISKNTEDKSKIPPTQENTSETDKLLSDLAAVAFIAVILIGIGLLIAGASDKVVIYYDGSEMAIAFLSVLIPLAAALMFEKSPFESELFNSLFSWIFVPGIGILGIVMLIVNFQQSIQHSRGLTLGIFVGIFRLAFAALTVLVVLGQFNRLMSNESKSKDTAGAIIILAIFGFLAKAMINGPCVYSSKGWRLPEKAQG